MTYTVFNNILLPYLILAWKSSTLKKSTSSKIGFFVFDILVRPDAKMLTASLDNPRTEVRNVYVASSLVH